MADYRRWYVPGGTYFFTLVTYLRHPLFADPAARKLLGHVMREEREMAPFQTVACCLLPDHLHLLWALPAGDCNYSGRIQRIKSVFTRRWLERGGRDAPVSTARSRRGCHGIWQPRFWESVIDDEVKFEPRFDYIHYNPVKHEHVGRPWDWQPSTFHRYVALGHYPWNWGESEPRHLHSLDFE